MGAGSGAGGKAFGVPVFLQSQRQGEAERSPGFRGGSPENSSFLCSSQDSDQRHTDQGIETSAGLYD